MDRLARGGIGVSVFLHYNFCRIHKTLRVTPAMEAGLAQHPWTIEELVELLNAAEKKAAWPIGGEHGLRPNQRPQR